MPTLLDTAGLQDAPADVEYTGVLRTPSASPVTGLLGPFLGLATFFLLAPLVTSGLVWGYWIVTGGQGSFQDAYRRLTAYAEPFGMAAVQVGLATLIPIAVALVVLVHRIRPSYLLSVAAGLRWRAVAVLLGVAVVTMNAVLWTSNALQGRPFVWDPQPDLPWFAVAILLTSPLQAAAEEIFFRGYLMQALGSLSRNHWVGVVASALVFALMHGTQNAWLFGSRFAFGLLAGWLVVATGGLEAGIAAHVVNNVFAFLYAGLSGGIAALKATREVTPADAVGEIVMYAVYAAVAAWVARRLHLATRTAPPVSGGAGLSRTRRVR